MNAVSGQRLEIHLVGLGLLQQQNRRATLRSSQRLRSGFSKKKPLESLENIQTCCCWCRGKLKCCVYGIHDVFLHLCSCKTHFNFAGGTHLTGTEMDETQQFSESLKVGCPTKSFTVIANYEELGVVGWNSNMFNINSPCMRPLDTPSLTTRKPYNLVSEET